MAEKRTLPGRLIAVDGSRGKDVAAAADALAAGLKSRGIECGISRWDASGLFSELAAAGRTSRGISVRALSLVYAADLAFRLRWEIRPILEAGGIVIAAPYVDTAVAFGSSAGLGDAWLRDLMRFAPAPGFRGRAQERKIDRPWKPRLDRGYAEYAAVTMDAGGGNKLSRKERRAMMAALEEPGGRKVFHLTAKGVEALAKALTGSRKAASRPSASRPRTARK